MFLSASATPERDPLATSSPLGRMGLSFSVGAFRDRAIRTFGRRAAGRAVDARQGVSRVSVASACASTWAMRGRHERWPRRRTSHGTEPRANIIQLVLRHCGRLLTGRYGQPCPHAESAMPSAQAVERPTSPLPVVIRIHGGAEGPVYGRCPRRMRRSLPTPCRMRECPAVPKVKIG
jgi:hypothetical protein